MHGYVKMGMGYDIYKDRTIIIQTTPEKQSWGIIKGVSKSKKKGNRRKREMITLSVIITEYAVYF